MTIDSVAAGGDGVGRESSGRVVFVPRTAPGDRVVACVRRCARRHVSAVPLRFLARGAERREPPCPLYAGCGGCQLQHLPPPAQREAKRRIVADALARIAGVEAEVPAALAPGPELGYRNRVTFHLRREGSAVTAGYHRWEGGDDLLDAPDCPLGEAPLREAWRGLRRTWGEGARLLPAGRELRLSLRTTAGGAVGLLVRGGGPGGAGDASRLLRAVPGLTSLWWRDRRGRRRHLGGAERLEEEWLGLALRLGPETFLQVNRRAAALIEAETDRMAGPVTGRRALDLYAGVGARAIRWAAAGARVTAVERDAEAVEAGREAVAGRGAEVAWVVGAVEASLDLLPAEVVVVNPPRNGLAPEVTRALARRPQGRLVYVSCDPATLARDVVRLGRGWQLVEAQPIDAFPNTAHVETVALLEPV